MVNRRLKLLTPRNILNLELLLLNGSGTVNGTKELDWKCDVASGCTNDWKPVGITK
jgi:hypothetical protein